MNIKKSKIALALGTLIFLAAPLSSAFANQNNCQMGGTMASIKSELRGYVQGVKGDDVKKMQQHMNALLQLSEKATQVTPAMDHSKMDMKEMTGMDHSKMDMKEMAGMDHSKMDMKEMADMDHSKMDMKEMADMDHSKMDMKEMAGMDHSKMDMNEMATMQNMEGMSNEQHQHMMYMHNMTELNDMFKQLSKTQEKNEIKVILGKIKDHSEKNQMFKKECN